VRSETDSDEVQQFAWLGHSPIQEAACLTFVRGSDPRRVAASFGAVVDHARTLDFDEFCEEAFAHHDRHPVIGVRRIGDWVLVVEDNGDQGSRPEVLRRVSARSEALSAFWNAQGRTRFSYAVDTEVRTSFEAIMPDYRDGARPDALEEIRAGLPWCINGVDNASLMLALCARITGRALTPESLTEPFLTFPVASWPDDLPSCPDDLPEPPDHDRQAELYTALRRAGGQAQRRAAAAVARHVLEHAGCVGHPPLAAIAASAEVPGDAERLATSEIVRSWTWELSRHLATSAVRLRARAAEVLRQAMNADPLTAALAALSAASTLRGLESAELSRVVSAALCGSEQAR
jgi:hypothetical protein